jgi:Tol biopolymer transport system component
MGTLDGDYLAAIALPEQPALSPDGTQVVYVLTTFDIAADRQVRQLWRAGTRQGEPHQLTRGQSDTSPAWSPDGHSIAFLRAGTDGPAQLWRCPPPEASRSN